jgi:hypothetical protein
MELSMKKNKRGEMRGRGRAEMQRAKEGGLNVGLVVAWLNRFGLIGFRLWKPKPNRNFFVIF